MPFFLPIQDHDTRLQALDNISFVKGDHFIKAGAEWNRTETDQTFIGFANGRFIFSSVTAFINYVNGSGAPLLYLQQAGVGGLSVEQAGTQSIVQNELAL